MTPIKLDSDSSPDTQRCPISPLSGKLAGNRLPLALAVRSQEAPTTVQRASLLGRMETVSPESGRAYAASRAGYAKPRQGAPFVGVP